MERKLQIKRQLNFSAVVVCNFSRNNIVMTTSIFIMIWLNYSNAYLSDDTVQQNWDDSSKWTDYLLYRTDSSGKYLLLNKLSEFGFSNSEFEYRKNDITVFSKETYKNIDYYDNSGTTDTSIPICIDAIIEHENDYRRCFEEVRKLIEIKAKLKVLITYPPDSNSKNAIIKKMGKCIKQSNMYLHENNEVEYLLVLGYNQKGIKWEFIVFDTEGKITESK